MTGNWIKVSNNEGKFYLLEIILTGFRVADINYFWDYLLLSLTGIPVHTS